MRIIHVRRLRGPNQYVSWPVAVALVDLEELTRQETSEWPDFTECLLRALPGLAEHHCGAGRPNGLVDKMRRGTYAGHVAEHVALELSHLIGREVHFGRTVDAGRAGLYRVIMECPVDEWDRDPIPERLFRLAVRVVAELAGGRTLDIRAELAELTADYERSRLGVSSQALADAARARGIPVRRLSDAALLQLGHGQHRRRVWAAMDEHTSAIGVDVASDKEITKRLLDTAGIPVADGIAAYSEQEAVAAFEELGGPVVVKPVAGHHGQDVHLELRAPDAVATAYREISQRHAGALVEVYVPGTDYRVLMVGGRLVAATQLTAAHVVGDGESDIAALVELANDDPRRGEGHDRPLTRITLDEAVTAYLAVQGFRPDKVPAADEVVWLRRTANMSTGGTGRDVTDLVHPDVTRLCQRTAAAVGLDVCGIDLRLADISGPWAPGDGSGVVLEVNASPGLRMHLSPTKGEQRDVAGAIIDHMYPTGTPSRVPIVSVTGTNGKTTTVRMIAHVLRATGLRVGMTSTDGVFVDHALVYPGDSSGARSAEMVLDDPTVQAAVLETARGGILGKGLGYDRADVAVVTNITADHLGVDGIEDIEDLVRVKALVAEEIADRGSLVLNADDPHCVGLATSPAVASRDPNVLLFSLDPANPVLLRHVRQGGTGYLLDDGWLIEAEGPRRTPLLNVADVALTFGGLAAFNVANTLAVVAACRALDVPRRALRDALVTFDGSLHNAGRSAVYHIGERPVVVDYAHNTAALTAIGGLLRRRWGSSPVVALTLPGDRSDELVSDAAYAVGCLTDRVAVYEDIDLRDREPGEMTKLITAALCAADPSIKAVPCTGMEDAFTTALSMAAPDEPVLLVYEKLTQAQDMLAEHRAIEGMLATTVEDTIKTAVNRLDGLHDANSDVSEQIQSHFHC
ncbi:cyanophycin synthetase [Nocardia sp. NBC_01499]|uniref:cyanophycin synthetase n=1 Tax=Nocardia sp. NBC_01499 TaxID=2903597 RepID=UPI00386371A0